MGRRDLTREAMIALGFLILAVILLWPVTLGGKSLVPFDILFSFPPWSSLAEELGVGVPQNGLMGDLVLQNYAWKRLILEAIQDRELPLWNPYLLTGVPFLAAGQHSALYPFSIIYYVLPLPSAYGWFTALHLALAGFFTYLLLRTLGAGRVGGVTAGIGFGFSLFMVTAAVHPMILAGAAWLPLILAWEERALRSLKGGGAGATLAAILAGAATVAMPLLAGHMEISYYIGLVAGAYGLVRLGVLWRGTRDARSALRGGGALAGMAILGLGLASVQWLPFLETAQTSFRAGATSYEEAAGYSYSERQLLTFVSPDVYGNPGHHAYFDLLNRRTVAPARNLSGQNVASLDATSALGVKNYVEAGSYVGILTLVLAGVAILGSKSRSRGIFVGLGGISLLLAFGTPLYTVLFFLFPGVSQLHTPFRWVLPYSLSAAVLSGLGAEALLGRAMLKDTYGRRRAVRWLARTCFASGVALLMLSGAIFFAPQSFVEAGETLFRALQGFQSIFADGSALLSYQWRNLLHLSLGLTGSGAVVLLWFRGRRRLGVGLAIVVLAGDLVVIGKGFLPAVDPGLAEVRPAALAFLSEDPDVFRVSAFDAGERTLHANSGMPYGLQDIRGYDSLIPGRYVELLNNLETQGELIYNRIAPLSDPASLRSPLLDLLNVKYVLSEVPLEAPGFTLVYEGQTRIYRNEDALPRAFAVPRAEVVDGDSEMLRRLSEADLTRVVLLEEDPGLGSLDRSATSDPGYRISVTEYGLSEVKIRAQMPEPGWLVLSDAYSPGWQAFVSSEGVPEEELPLYRANFQFRAVPLDAGEHTVRFRYFPWSVKLGLYFSFISAMTLVGGAGAWAWRRFYREAPGQTAAARVLKNTTIPLAALLFNKAVDLGFALLVLRALGPAGQGKYAFAIFLVGYVEIVSNFGLNTLLAREVAKDPSQGNRFLTGTALLRLLLLTGLTPIVLAFIFVWRSVFDLAGDTAAAILLLTLALVPGSVSAALSSLFTAHERMEIPAAVSSVATLLKVGFGALALVLGFGFVGLAAVAVVVNMATLAVLLERVVRTLFRPRFEWDRRFSGGLLGVSFPLMINHLLNTVFFRIDILLLQPLRGNLEVGWYSAAYKVLDGLLLIPSTVTIALFPMLSRFAEEAPDTLLRTYRLAMKLLLSTALPISILVSAFSDPIIAVLGGPQYLPQASIALRILIWFLPLSFVNGLTQYVLISVNQQRYLTRAFLIGTGFNLIANLAVIPEYGFQGAAAVTVLSEVVLFIPFAFGVRKFVGPIPWLQLAGRPVVAGAVMVAVLLLALSVSSALALLVSLPVYAGAILAVGTFDTEERALLVRLLPFHGRLPGRR